MFFTRSRDPLLPVLLVMLLSGCVPESLPPREQPTTGMLRIELPEPEAVRERTLPPYFYGINLNYIFDGEWSGRSGLLADDLSRLGARIVRYPGGEKSDATFFAHPPDFTQPGPVLIPASEWPRLDATLHDPTAGRFHKSPLGFEDFVKLLDDTGARALLVLPYDIQFITARGGAPPPTRQELIAHARAYVAHASKHGVRPIAWEIGNESYMSGSYNGHTTAEQYARDLLEFARAIREADPEAKIAACGPQNAREPGDKDRARGDNTPWWRTVLSLAAEEIDFLSLHSYPVYGWGGFDAYRSRDITLSDELRLLDAAVDEWAPGHAGRIRYLLTETNAADWAGLHGARAWEHDNTFGHGLVLFDILLSAAAHPRVDAALLWNTRWKNNKTQPEVWDAIAPDGTLLPTGVALSLASRHMNGRVSALAPPAPQLRVFLARLPDSPVARLAVINKSAESTTVALPEALGKARLIARWTPDERGPAGPERLDTPERQQPALLHEIPATSLLILETGE